VLDILTDHITAISKATRQALVDFEYLPQDRIDVIYNGIHGLKADPQATQQLRDQYNIPVGATILGTIARLDPIKNHTMMLQAFNQVLSQHPNTCLIMVGDGEERANIENQITELGIADKVILTGYESKPHNLLNLMDIFLLSSLSEGTSMTLLEAMSLSKPCVVTDAGGNGEIIENEDNGLVTPNDDAATFADAILRLIREPDTLNTMQESARQRFDRLFTASAMARAYKEIY
jgi:glycosyltransferase involved in cell wall biosynthesis